jgi:hypothetical protein
VCVRCGTVENPRWTHQCKRIRYSREYHWHIATVFRLRGVPVTVRPGDSLCNSSSRFVPVTVYATLGNHSFFAEMFLRCGLWRAVCGFCLLCRRWALLSGKDARFRSCRGHGHAAQTTPLAMERSGLLSPDQSRPQSRDGLRHQRRPPPGLAARRVRFLRRNVGPPQPPARPPGPSANREETGTFPRKVNGRRELSKLLNCARGRESPGTPGSNPGSRCSF